MGLGGNPKKKWDSDRHHLGLNGKRAEEEIIGLQPIMLGGNNTRVRELDYFYEKA